MLYSKSPTANPAKLIPLQQVDEISDLRRRVRVFYKDVESYDWVQASQRWVGIETLFHRWRRNIVWALFSKYSVPGSCVDVGCGTGLMSGALSNATFSIDLNRRALVKAGSRKGSARLIQGDAEAIPLADSSVENVLVCEVIEHLLSPRQCLTEIHRILKPGGVVIGSTPRK